MAHLLSKTLAPMLLATALCSATLHAQSSDPDDRAAHTLAQLSKDEKLGMLQSVLTARLPDDKRPPGIPAGVGHVTGIPRLGVPILAESDASLGVANMGGFMRPKDGATALPSALAMASTWNPALVEEAGRMMGAETRAKGFNVLLAGGVNLVREPRNGRNFEYFSEDPWLSGTLAGHSVRGIQSNRIVSTLKHFLLNSQETGRAFLDVQIGEAQMRESDLLAFQIAQEIGQPGAVMCAYNKVNGVHACENSFLLNDILRRDWGFKGWVLSDWGGLHSVPIRQGLDQESGVSELGSSYFGKPLREALAEGKLTTTDIDRSVLRILRTMYALGLIDDPVKPGRPIDFTANAQIAQRVAEQGIVLLKNEGNLLPIASTAQRILVVGGHADVGVPSGGGSSQVWPAGGASLSLPIRGDVVFHRRLYMPSSPLVALREQFPEAEITYDDGSDLSRAVLASKRADFVAIFAEQFTAEGHDVLDLNLPGNQNVLIEAVAKAIPKTAVVLETGGPVAMPWLGRIKAVVQSWYPGQRGGHAIARVLSGAVNPSGRLPVTFPASLQQLPNPVIPGSDRITYRPGTDLYDMPKEQEPLLVTYPEGSDVGYRWFAKHNFTPLFAFGHGLSYTQFATSTPKLSGTTARFTVRNTGDRPGATVGQLYMVSRAGSAQRRLVGYQWVALAPGEERTVSLTIDPRLLADWNKDHWTMPGGQYQFALGESAQRLGPTVSVRLTARDWRDHAAGKKAK